MHDFLDHYGADVVVCMRCGLAEFELGWEACVDAYVQHTTVLAVSASIVRNPKTGRVMMITRAE